MSDDYGLDSGSEESFVALIESYCRADYHVASPICSLTFHVGELLPEQNQTLLAAGVISWTLVTAWNPYSQEQTAEWNDAAQAKLKAEIENASLNWWEAAHTNASSEWPTEESYCVLNTTSAQAYELCRTYRQLAVLCGDAEHEPWLLFADWNRLGDRLKAALQESRFSVRCAEQLEETVCQNDAFQLSR